MPHVWGNLIVEMINLSGTIIATIVTRWLLKLSTVDEDMKWMKSTKVYKVLVRLKFYRGSEYLYQVRSWRVYSSSAS